MHRWTVLLLLWTFGCASGVSVSEPVRNALSERFTLSRIEAPAIGGHSLRPGVTLTLERDGMPAMPLRITHPSPELPGLHAGDYALVEVAQDDQVTIGPGQYRLARGTQLAILDLKMDADRVRLFTHTIEPVAHADGGPVYGCTGFVFWFAPAILQGDDPAFVLQRIDQWLRPAL